MANGWNEDHGKPYETLTALIADRDPVIFSAIRSSLTEVGFTIVDGASDMQKLQQAIAESDPDLLICDLQLSGGGVAEMARDVRRGRTGHRPYLCMIATTWLPHEETIRRALRAGFDDVLLKPIRMRRLIQHIHQLATPPRRFVVTPGYVGPDRRRHDLTAATRSGLPVFDAPNVLAPQPADAEAARRLVAAIRKISRAHWHDRLLPLLHPVLEALENLTEDLGQQEGPDERAPALAALGQEIAQLEDALEAHDDHHVAELVRTVSDTIAGIETTGAADDAAEIRMLRDLGETVRHVLASVEQASQVAHGKEVPAPGPNAA